ncbi:MAG: hypothetical protein K9G26_10580 [Emcibacter sp.]|nr:hypothetical protein [Emcibacter sp.]
MRTSIIISIVFHVSVMLLGFIGLPMLHRDRPVEMKTIPIEVISIGEMTKLKAQEKEPEPTKREEPEKKSEPERKVEMPPEPPKLVSTMPLPDIKAKPKPKEKPVENKKPVQTAENRIPKVTPKPKPSRFNTGKLAALLDKREKSEPDIIEKLENKEYGQEKIISDVDIRQQTLSIIDAIDKHIYDNQCWNIPAGAKGAEGLRVSIRMRLDIDGRLIGSPKIVDASRMDAPGQEYFRTAAESALRAVLKCAPYNFLPKDQYNLWRDIEIIFDPEQMLNG